VPENVITLGIVDGRANNRRILVDKIVLNGNGNPRRIVNINGAPIGRSGIAENPVTRFNY